MNPLLERILVRYVVRPTGWFFTSLRADRFFLVSWLAGSYLILQTVGNDLLGFYRLCNSGPGCAFPSLAVMFLGIVLMLGSAERRLTILEFPSRVE